MMTVATLTRMPNYRMMQIPALAELYVRVVREASQVAAACGVPVDDWQGLFPVKTVAALPIDDAVRLVIGHGAELERRGATRVKVSMLQSAEAERPLEVEAIQGFIVREAARRGVDVPILSVAHPLLSGMNEHYDEVSTSREPAPDAPA
jgi:ketopantoate reductase